MAVEPRVRKSAEERREEILEVAVRHFAIGGLHGTSTEAIAREAGISQPYIYALFPNKHELFLAVHRHVIDRIRRAFLEAARGGVNLPLRKFGVVDKFVDLHDVKQTLELHKLVPNESYYLAFMLVGAYQEVMGNNHNLFGTPHEAQIHIDEEGYLIKKVIRGTTVGEAAGRAR